jgi:hypothetical protein
MDILDFVEAWWLSVKQIFVEDGVVGSFERSAQDRPNPSCNLILRRNGVEVDLLVWKFGEAEFATMRDDGTVDQEHFDDVCNAQTLGGLLMRVATFVLLRNS